MISQEYIQRTGSPLNLLMAGKLDMDTMVRQQAPNMAEELSNYSAKAT
jgi:hypothetical protein